MEKKIILQAKHVHKTFFSANADTEAIHDISLDVYENEFLVLLGPGQSGKTVFLKLLSGLLAPTSGEIFFEGRPLKGIDTKIGTIFQKIGLYEWKTAMENAEIGLKYKRLPKKERRENVQKYLELVGLQGFENSYPHELSGGMKQRVGIARAYAADPDILLMDEPFGALDAQTRSYMEQEILRIWSQEKRTVIFVTNNIEEAVFLGDRIVQFSSCPAVVKNVYDLSSLGRPRDYISAEFLEMRELISSSEELNLEQ